MKAIAQIENGVVANVALWDGTSDWDGTMGGKCATVDITAMSPKPGVGWSYSGGAFAAPAPVPDTSPDPNGFVTAVASNASLSSATKIAATSQLASLVTAVESGQTALISTMWPIVIAQYQIPSADQAIVKTLANEYHVPGFN